MIHSDFNNGYLLRLILVKYFLWAWGRIFFPVRIIAYSFLKRLAAPPLNVSRHLRDVRTEFRNLFTKYRFTGGLGVRFGCITPAAWLSESRPQIGFLFIKFHTNFFVRVTHHHKFLSAQVSTHCEQVSQYLPLTVVHEMSQENTICTILIDIFIIKSTYTINNL